MTDNSRNLPATDPSAIPGLTLRRTFKDSVFTSLFSDREYAYGFYRALHPEDRSSTARDVRIVTVQNALTVCDHNDLGFLVGDTLMVLVEAQSTWSPNIALRALLYAAQTIKDLIHERAENVYGTAALRLPRPELYVVYTGLRGDVPATVSLSEANFGGAGADLEATVHVLDEAGPSLPGQYIDFARTLDARRIELGPNEHAIRAAIDDCRRRGVLAEYLTAHEKEVVSIMMTLFDEEEVLRNYVASERRAAVAEGLAEGLAEGHATGLAEGHATGLAEGRATGLAAGRAEGRAEGRLEGHAEGQAVGIVGMCKDFGLTMAATASKLAEKLSLSIPEAEALAKNLW
jgi:hypothetical protein